MAREGRRAAAGEARAAALEDHLAATLAAEQAARTHAREVELSSGGARAALVRKDLDLSETAARLAFATGNAEAANAESAGARERASALLRSLGEAQNELRMKEAHVQMLEQRERYRSDEDASNAAQRLGEAEEAQGQLHAALQGREERHMQVLDAMRRMRQVLSERETKSTALVERLATLENVELPSLREELRLQSDKEAAALAASEGSELRLKETRRRFEQAQAQLVMLSRQLHASGEQLADAERAKLEGEALATAARREAALATQQRAAESARANALGEELKVAREALRAKSRDASQLRAALDGASERLEGAKESAILEAHRVRAAEAALESSREEAAELRSRLQLREVETKGVLSHAASLANQLQQRRLVEGWGQSAEVYAQARHAVDAAAASSAALEMRESRIRELEAELAARQQASEAAIVKSRRAIAAADGAASDRSFSASLARVDEGGEQLGADAQRQVDWLLTNAAARGEELALVREELEAARVKSDELGQRYSAAADHNRVLRERQSILDSEARRRERALVELAEALQTARMELKLGGAVLKKQNVELQGEVRALAAELEALGTTPARLASLLGSHAARSPAVATGGGVGSAAPPLALTAHAQQRFFHNTCLLIKLLLKSDAPNVSIPELFEAALDERVPADEWPIFVYRKLSLETLAAQETSAEPPRPKLLKVASAFLKDKTPGKPRKPRTYSSPPVRHIPSAPICHTSFDSLITDFLREGADAVEKAIKGGVDFFQMGGGDGASETRTTESPADDTGGTPPKSEREESASAKSESTKESARGSVGSGSPTGPSSPTGESGAAPPPEPNHPSRPPSVRDGFNGPPSVRSAVAAAEARHANRFERNESAYTSSGASAPASEGALATARSQW